MLTHDFTKLDQAKILIQEFEDYGQGYPSAYKMDSFASLYLICLYNCIIHDQLNDLFTKYRKSDQDIRNIRSLILNRKSKQENGAYFDHTANAKLIYIFQLDICLLGKQRIEKLKNAKYEISIKCNNQ